MTMTVELPVSSDENNKTLEIEYQYLQNIVFVKKLYSKFDLIVSVCNNTLLGSLFQIKNHMHRQVLVFLVSFVYLILLQLFRTIELSNSVEPASTLSQLIRSILNPENFSSFSKAEIIVLLPSDWML